MSVPLYIPLHACQFCLSLCSLNLSPLFVSLHVSLILCLSRCLSFISIWVSVFLVSLSHSHAHSHLHNPDSMVIDWGAAAPSEQNLFLPVRMRNAKSGTAAGAPETLQNRLPSVEAESWNNEKLSVNSRFLPPAPLRTGSFAFSLDANSPTHCKAKY